MSEIYFKQIFEYPIKEFQQHLEQEWNERIIFSGKYGIGKTKFLKDFFDTGHQESLFGSQKYKIYSLYPVNYSIASNEDIIRYIKYDIIIEMLKKGVQFEEIKLKLTDTLPGYVIKNLHKVMAGLVYMIPKVGKEIVECFEKIDELKEEYLKYHDETNKTGSDKLIEYLEKIELKEGSIYEGDITTQIISTVVSGNDECESVLIIDDIDRLDPEHVFRILNVFASHFDGNSLSAGKNKFNFDKIIIVCDFNNIRNIFHHRYGIEVDFVGYIDKFYSSDVYHFDNKEALAGIIENVLNSIKLHPANIGNSYSRFGFLPDLISLLITENFVSLRGLLKVYGNTINYHNEKIIFSKKGIEIDPYIIPIVLLLKLTRDFFGDYINMKRIFERMTLTNELISDRRDTFGELLYILSFETHRFRPREAFLYTFRETPIMMNVQTSRNDGRFQEASLTKWDNMTSADGKHIPGKELIITTKEMFKNALNDVLELLHKTGYIK